MKKLLKLTLAILLTLTLAVLMVLTLVACGDNTTTPDEPPVVNTPTPTPEQNDPVTPPNNSGGDDSTPDGGDGSDENISSAAGASQIIIENNSGGKFHLLTIQLIIGQYDTSESYDILEDGSVTTFNLHEANWERNYMLGAFETNDFSAHEFNFPDDFPDGSTIKLHENGEWILVGPDGFNIFVNFGG